MIFLPGCKGEETGVGLPSPGARENPPSAGVSSILSSQLVTGDAGVASSFSNSGILESKMLYSGRMPDSRLASRVKNSGV